MAGNGAIIRYEENHGHNKRESDITEKYTRIIAKIHVAKTLNIYYY